MANSDFVGELTWRGMLHQTTEGLAAHMSTPGRVAYAGFDPTADSLTIGNLVPAILLARLQRCGHKPIVVVGGATGLIGDPSGKSTERQLLDPVQVHKNVQGQRKDFEKILDFTGPNAAIIVDNAEWLLKMGYIEVLRDVGKHFSINQMVTRDSVANRLESREQGLSYTEFSYMILQAYDFAHLYKAHKCTVQLGGSDQYGNILSGIDLIRRLSHGEGFGLTAPLLLKSDGTKFGKSESGNVWLSPARTSPYRFHQFWLNAADDEVGKLLRWFTFMDRGAIEALEAQQKANPSERAAQKALADSVTEMIHGAKELARAKAAASALFSGDVRALDAQLLGEVTQDVTTTSIAAGSLEGEGTVLLDLLAATPLAASKREARDFLSAGAVSVNGEKAAADARLTRKDLLHGTTILLRRGKKQWHAVKVAN
ncbi:MAG: tyrosine--tRNA ligase [Planctomycetes bacterium]|nr:tyrosine--tRNA ligase [Planctomycetota bacterium]